MLFSVCPSVPALLRAHGRALLAEASVCAPALLGVQANSPGPKSVQMSFLVVCIRDVYLRLLTNVYLRGAGWAANSLESCTALRRVPCSGLSVQTKT